MASISNNPNSAKSEKSINTVRIAIFTAVLLLTSTLSLFFIQERSVIKTCLDLSAQNYNICFAGLDQSEVVSFDSQFKNKLNKVLERNADNNAVFYGLLAALVGGVAALLCVIALPTNQLQFTGNFEKSGGKIRVGGAVGIFLIFAAGGGWLAWTTAPGNERQTIKDMALDALNNSNSVLLNSNNFLKSTNTDLINGMASNADDFALSILNNGHFSEMNGSFEINCGYELSSEQQERLRVQVPHAGSNRSAELASSGFPIPLGALKSNLGRIIPETTDPDENFLGDNTSVLEINLERSEDRFSADTLVRMTYSLSPGATPKDRRVGITTVIVADNIASYCDDPTASGVNRIDSGDAGPLAGSGG